MAISFITPGAEKGGRPPASPSRSTQRPGHPAVGNATLREETSAWSTTINETQRGVNWQMKGTDARCKLKSVYPKIKT